MFVSLDRVVHGYHIYKEFWLANFGEILPFLRETANLHEPFVLVVLHERRIVGHLPREISALCALFIE